MFRKKLAFAMELALVALLAVGSSVSAAPEHEGDGKEQDALPPYPGTGQTGLAMAPDAQGRVLDMPTLGVTLLSWLSLQNLPGGSERASDVWGYTSPSGREYAIIGLERGTSFVDITDPVNPVMAGHVVSPASVWKEVTTSGPYAYVVTEAGGGMQVIDLRQIDSHGVTLTQTVTAGGLDRVHTIRTNPASTFVYLNGSNLHNGGLVAFNTSSPGSPQFAGRWADHYVHDAVITTYDSGPYAGREIAFACIGQYGLAILDVTNKSNITTLSTSVYPNVSYCHYGWLDADRRYFYINDEFDELNVPGLTSTTYVVDVTNLSAPQYVTSFTNGNRAIDHNPMGRDDYLFEANYRSGLRVYDISNPLSATEVGFFDTFPADDEPHFNGAWGVHVMPSGVVLVSDMERGLFVFDASLATDVETWGPSVADGVRLLPAYPNPSRGPVNLGFDLPAAGPASLKIFDVRGRQVAALLEGPAADGRTRLTWDPRSGEGVTAGVYFAVLNAESGRSSRRIVVVK